MHQSRRSFSSGLFATPTAEGDVRVLARLQAEVQSNWRAKVQRFVADLDRGTAFM